MLLVVGVQSAGHPEEAVEYANIGQRLAIVATKSELMVLWGIGSRLDERHLFQSESLVAGGLPDSVVYFVSVERLSLCGQGLFRVQVGEDGREFWQVVGGQPSINWLPTGGVGSQLLAGCH